ncbi:MAG: sigma-54-dependent Fis family transcriptional regulator [Deltaproteobacteria bacterium]|nr:sigma-54-dependent Fis family transcriptional regulator [Deltaproteobacteria bacterium]
MQYILLLSKNPDVYRQLIPCFGPEIQISRAENDTQAITMLQARRYEYLFMDISLLNMPDRSGTSHKSYIQSLMSLYPALDIIIITSIERIREAVNAVKEGASDYILFPIKPDEVNSVLKNIKEPLTARSEPDFLKDRFMENDIQQTMRSSNAKMKGVFEKLKSVSPTNSTVLITGETGTGKGVIARLIHRHSSRKDARFISVHCGAIPDTLLESELFGHERGAFTSAIKRKLGKFEIADKGTIFLDEIGTITPAAQIKLLQVLQDGIFQRVGGEVTIHTDARIIAATNMDLKKMCEDGEFRKDLYFRLNVFPIEVPLLRERSEDIPHLAMMFLDKMNKHNTKGIKGFSPDVTEAFMHYPWPGNIRELENLIERAYILENSSILQPESFPEEIFEYGYPDDDNLKKRTGNLANIRKKAIQEIEKNYLIDLLNETMGRIKQAAEKAGITTRQIHKLLTKYNIRKEDYKGRK